MSTLDAFKKDISLLVEAGMIAIKQGDEESAKKLFNAVGVLDPQSIMMKMGYGLICLHKMDTKGAQKYFQEILQAEPQNYRAQAFLGLSHILSVFKKDLNMDEKKKGLQKGAELAHGVVSKCKTESTVQLAQSLLDWEKELQTKAESKGAGY